MAAPATNKTIEFLRIGNPWLVGKNVSRVVPIYALHNLLAPDFDRESILQPIKHLAFDGSKGLAAGLSDWVTVAEHEIPDLEDTVFGLLAPERRIFRDKKNGGASKHGALFPLVAGLVSPVGSDDGLGRRMRELLEKYSSDWQTRLIALLAPSAASDPATGFAMALLRGRAGQTNPRTIVPAAQPLDGLDRSCAEFVDKLIIGVTDATRVPTIRNLAYGVYMAAIFRMVAGPVESKQGQVPLVLAFGGMPPGDPGDPLVRAACKSFQSWIAQSWRTSIELLAGTISKTSALLGATGVDKLRQQVRTLLQDRLEKRPKDIDGVMEILEPLMSGARPGSAWCREAVESKAVGFKQAELARRVRSLGTNIGLTGPDRGFGSPRLVVDTPLLGVLVRGIVGAGSMEFEQFVTTLTARFGLVLGLGEDDSIASRMEQLGSDGYDAYELLVRNQELVRERLLRAGLARAYSDSHTEVYLDA